MKSLSHVRVFVTPWTAAYQAPLSMGFSRQEYWSGLPFPYPANLWTTSQDTFCLSGCLILKQPLGSFLSFWAILSWFDIIPHSCLGYDVMNSESGLNMHLSKPKGTLSHSLGMSPALDTIMLGTCPTEMLPLPLFTPQYLNDAECLRQGARGWYTGMTQRDGMGREVGGGFRMGNTCTLWRIHVSVWQKPSQYCKVISLQLK